MVQFSNRLVGRTEHQDALQRLDTLTKETGMAVASNLVVSHVVDDNLKVIEEVTRGIDDNVRAIKAGAQSSLDFLMCLSTDFPLISQNRNGRTKLSVMP